MSARSRQSELIPRNGHTLVVLIVARISGCRNQKELSLDDQVDHAKEEIALFYEGPIEYRTICTKGKGERLDRPELMDVETAIRTREIDVLFMEDVGRLIRGTDANRLWGLAVDHQTRCIAPNDCVDTADDSWEEDLISACRDHVGHQSHTSKRIKQKKMNRFRKYGGATALPIAGYIVPSDSKCYDDWRRDESATETIQKGLAKLRESGNCSLVADYFNSLGFPTGPYCKRDKWKGYMVRTYYQNTLLAGVPRRGMRHTVKHHQSGRRISVPNTDAPIYEYEAPHLAHVDKDDLHAVNEMLTARNSWTSRKGKNGVDPVQGRPKQRTKFPGQYARCYYCGADYVWDGNGVTGNLTCANSRRYQCWNSIGINGAFATSQIVELILKELEAIDGFQDQFQSIVDDAVNRGSRGSDADWKQLQADERKFETESSNVAAAIRKLGLSSILEGEAERLELEKTGLAVRRRRLESLSKLKLKLPVSTEELRSSFEAEFKQLAIESPEANLLLRQIVPEFDVYLVRICDGGHLFPRARITLNLAGHIPDACHVPELDALLQKSFTIDLIDAVPQRERIREEVARHRGNGVREKDIPALIIGETPTITAVQRAMALQRQMDRLQLSTPYILVTEPPTDYTKLRRHRHTRYEFKPIEGYSPRPLE